MLGLGLGLQNGMARRTIYNILGSSGHLSADSDGNGLADGLQANLLINCSLSNNEQTTYAGTGTSHYSQYINANIASAGDTLYYGGWFKAGKGKASPVLYNRKADGTYENSRATGTLNASNYEFLSVTLTITSCFTPNYSYARQDIFSESGAINFEGNGENITFKDLHIVNLTLAGKTKSEMDAIVQSSGYFDRISI